MSIPVVLTIAGSDSGGGAGVQADIKAIQACGGFAASAITAVTAQNTVEVRDAFDLPAAVVVGQIEAVLDDLPVVAIKTGMLSSAEIVRAVAGVLERRRPRHLVVDPVMISKSGYPLLRGDAAKEMRERLIPLSDVVTPNLPEATALTGIAINGPDEALAAAAALRDQGARAVVVKGGHFEDALSTDYLCSASGTQCFTAERIQTRHTHGTGCTFASALATWLARGRELPSAVQRAKDYVTGAVRHGLPIGAGHGPTDHFFFLRNHGEADEENRSG